MRSIILLPLQSNRLSLFVQPHAYFEDVKIKSALLALVAGFRVEGYPISNDPRDHPIPVHRRALILGCNIQIASAVTRFVDDVTKPLWIHLKRTDD